jgi:hypothetical protein
MGCLAIRSQASAVSGGWAEPRPSALRRSASGGGTIRHGRVGSAGAVVRSRLNRVPSSGHQSLALSAALKQTERLYIPLVLWRSTSSEKGMRRILAP